MIHIFTIDLWVACIEVSSLSFCLPQLGTMLLYIFAKVWLFGMCYPSGHRSVGFQIRLS